MAGCSVNYSAAMRKLSVAIVYVTTILSLSSTSSKNMADALSFRTSELGSDNFGGDILEFVSRIYVPYGPDLLNRISADKQPWEGYGYGMGATTHWAYDHVNGFIYSQSDAGEYITVIDYKKLPGEVSKYSLDLTDYRSKILDIAICPEQGYLFLSMTDIDKILIYQTVKRGGRKVPKLIREIDAGTSPGALKLSNDCSTLAVANRNEGLSIVTEGALHLVTNFGTDSPTIKTVFLNTFDELELIDNAVHMPLTKRALQFHNKVDELELEELLANWNPAIALDPEYIAFNEDGSEVYLNLQDNSALVRIDVASGEAKRIDGYGLKSFTDGPGVDIVDDGKCNLYTNPCLYLVRAPDAIASVEIDGVNYVLTADEGSSYNLRDYAEKREADQVFAGNSSGIPGLTFSSDLFTIGDAASGCQANFNSACDKNDQPWCQKGFEISIGSSAVDYSNPENPVMDKIVGFGGRGMSIFRVPGSVKDPIEFVWDSGSEFELNTCKKSWDWAHNSLQNEEFSPLDGPAFILGDEKLQDAITARNDALDDGCEYPDLSTGACAMGYTIDERAHADGMAVEAVVVGVACDRLVTIACGANNAMCFLYDITDIESPILRKTFNLSPVSIDKNPENAYADQTMGDIGPETILFVDADKSPTGKTSIMFGGAISGTISFYEFVCETDFRDSSSTRPSGPLEALAASFVAWGLFYALL